MCRPFSCSKKLIRLDKMFNVILVVFAVMGASVGSPVSPAYEIAADLTSTTAFNDLIYCKTDQDCPESSFCGDYVTPICEECYNCQTKNRRFGANKCAKSSYDCGDCIDGYTALGNPEMKETCYPNKRIEDQMRKQRIVMANQAQKEAVQRRHVKGQLEQVDAPAYLRQEIRMQEALSQVGQSRLRQVPTQGMNNSDGWMTEPKWLLVLLCSCCFLTIALALFIYLSTKSDGRRMVDEDEPTVTYHRTTPTSPSPPPPYGAFMNRHDDDDTISGSFELNVIGSATLDCKAIPYRGDDALRFLNSAYQSSDVSSSTDGNNVAPTAPLSGTPATAPTSESLTSTPTSRSSATTPTSELSATTPDADIDIHDENTEPSNWTPGGDPEDGLWHFSYLNSYEYDDDNDDDNTENENRVTSSNQQPSKRKSMEDHYTEQTKKRKGG